MKTSIIIPARYASTRFPGKPLALIQGRPMIQWVHEKAQGARLAGEVWVATDDDRIAEAVKKFGGKVRMTSPDHPSGTDRVAEVARDLASDIIVNLQGDEPAIDSEQIDLVIRALADDPIAHMATLAAPIESEEEKNNPNVVKVVFDNQGNALYFSRYPIPFQRDPKSSEERYKHIGLYAYRRDFLQTFSSLPPTPLEKSECLEQLRALENGYRIKVAVTRYRGAGVDTPEDWERLNREWEGR